MAVHARVLQAMCLLSGARGELQEWIVTLPTMLDFYLFFWAPVEGLQGK